MSAKPLKASLSIFSLVLTSGLPSCAEPRQASPSTEASPQLAAVIARRAAGHGPRHLIFIPAGTSADALALTPAQVVIIRHGEKPKNGPDLNRKGEKRAQALVNYFETNPVMSQFGAPVAIYAMEQHHKNTSARPIETVQPLADDLGLDVQHSYLRDNYQPMVNDIMNNTAYDGKTVVISWEHNVIPSIAQAFGAPAPSSWDGNQVYDRSWVINFDGSSTPTFQDLPQDVLPSDSPTGSGSTTNSPNQAAATSASS